MPAPEPVSPADIDITPTAQEEPVPDPYLEPPPRWLVAAKTWLLTGNLVAKLGLVILFIGIGFLLKYAAATLAVPLALDARWTSAAWAVEGAGFVWFGLRNRRQLALIFGLLLHAGAWVSFIAAASGLSADAALAASLWLGYLLLGASAFIIATDLRKHAGDDDSLPELAGVGLLLAAIALLGACWSEAILRTAGGSLANWMVAGALFSAMLLYLVGARMAWPLARGLALAAQIAGAAAVGIVCAPGRSFMTMLEASGEQPLLGVFMLAGAAFATSRMLQRADVGQPDSGHSGNPAASALLLWAGIWWFGAVFSIAAGRMVDYLPAGLGSPYARWIFLYAAAVTFTAIAGVRLGPRMAWPQLRWLAGSCWGMLVLVTAGALNTLYLNTRCRTRRSGSPGRSSGWAASMR